MPVYERTIDPFDNVDSGNLVIFEDRPEPTTGELWSAIWETTATKGLYDWITEPDFTDQPDFDPNWSTLDPKYDHIFTELRETGSQAEFDAVIAREDKRMEIYDTIARSGFEGITYSLASAALDPITLPLWFVPVTKGFQAAGTMGRMARMTGYAGADMAARETIFHHAQPSLTYDDTLRTMFVGASLAASFGALSGAATRKTRAAARKNVDKEAEWNAEKTHESAVEARHESVGAMRAGPARPSVALEKPLKGAGWFHKIAIKSPNIRLAYSTNAGLAAPAKIGSELTYTGTFKAKHAMNIAEDYPPLDTLLRRERQTSEAYFMDELKRLRDQVQKNHGERLTIDELARQVEVGVVYGDEAVRFTEMMDIVKTERAWRNAMLGEMKALGMLPEEMTGAQFNKYYGPRMYDQAAVQNKTSEWVRGVSAGYRARGDTRTDEELLNRALDAQQNISTSVKTGQGASFGLGLHARTPGRLKAITLEVDDDFIEPFLIRDVRKARDSLIRTLYPEIVLRQRYGQVIRTQTGFKVPKIDDILEEEYKRVRKTLVDKGDDEGIQKLLKAHEQNKKDIDHILTKLSGMGEFNSIMTPKVAGFLNEVRAYAGSAWLGNSMIASLHEPLRTAMEHGFGPMMRSTQLTAFPRAPTKVFVEQMRAFGVGLELRTHGSTAILRAEIDDPGMLPKGGGSMAQRYLAPAMYKYNGQNWFNQTFKTGAATTHGDQMVRFALGKQSVTGAEEAMTRARFAQVGMGTPELNRLNEMARKGFVEEIEGVYFIDLDNMTDRGLAETIGNSMMMVADSTIVTPGAGALPIMLDNQLGRMLTQFRNVFFNMQGKTIMPTAQRIAHGDLRTVRGLTAMMGMSWLIYQIRFAGKVGYDPDKIREEWRKQGIQDHMREALERSGMTGLTFEMFSALDNLAEGNISRMIGLNEGSRYFYRRSVGLGQMVPGAAWAEKVGRGAVGPGLSGDGFTQADANALGYALPLRTIFYLDPIFDQIQEATVENLPTGDQRKRNYRENDIQF